MQISVFLQLSLSAGFWSVLSIQAKNILFKVFTDIQGHRVTTYPSFWSGFTPKLGHLITAYARTDNLEAWVPSLFLLPRAEFKTDTHRNHSFWCMCYLIESHDFSLTAYIIAWLPDSIPAGRGTKQSTENKHFSFLLIT